MDVALLWFECKEKDCNYIPFKTKTEKIKRAWRYGKSTSESARPRMFMRYVEGNYERKADGDIIIFNCKYGAILLYHYADAPVNSYYYPIQNTESCNVCLQRIENEGALFQ